MPTISGIEGPYRFFFFSFDCREPQHVHADRETSTCKFWLDPVMLASNHGMSPRELRRIRAIILEHLERFARNGMSTALSIDSRIREMRVTNDEIIASLTDGRTISVPLVWSWRLSDATAEQRQNFRLIGDGIGVHWPDIDEDISVQGMLSGFPAMRPVHR